MSPKLPPHNTNNVCTAFHNCYLLHLFDCIRTPCPTLASPMLLPLFLLACSVTGTAYGFVRGYTEALNLSALLLRQGCAKGARLVFKLLSRAGAALSSSAMKLPAALPGGCRFICRGICRGGRIT